MEPGQWIRAVGSDIAAGAVVLPAGERLGAAEIGILATVGAATVQVNTDSSLPARSPPGLMLASCLSIVWGAQNCWDGCTIALCPGSSWQSALHPIGCKCSAWLWKIYCHVVLPMATALLPSCSLLVVCRLDSRCHICSSCSCCIRNGPLACIEQDSLEAASAALLAGPAASR